MRGFGNSAFGNNSGFNGYSNNRGFAQQQQQPMRGQLYNLRDIANGSDIFNLCFDIDPAIDRITPQIAYYTAHEIQQRAGSGNAARMAVFDFVSENAFDNNEFRQLVWVIVNRVGYGMVNGEWRALQEAVSAVITRVCKAYTGAYVSFNQDLQNEIVTNQNIANDVAADSRLWDYCMALANGQAAWEPFRTEANTQATPRSVINNSRSCGDSGAFVTTRQPAPTSEIPFTQVGVSRYERIRDRMTEEQEQHQLEQPNRSSFGTRALMPTQQVSTPEPAVRNQSMDQKAPIKQKPAAAPQTYHKAMISGVEVEIVRQVPDGEKLWKPTKLQPYRAAYCRRTHFMTYFETRDGLILSFLGKLKPENIELLMNYDEHAIDPTMGRPIQNAKKNPVREEARILYTEAEEVKVNITVKPNPTMVDSLESAVAGALTYGRRKAKNTDPIISSSVVNKAIVMATASEAEANLDVLMSIGACKTLKEAGSLIKKITDPQLKAAVTEGINADINTLLCDTLNIAGAHVGEEVYSYSDDLEDQLKLLDVEDTDYANRFASRIGFILAANTRAQRAEACPEYVDAVLADHDREHADEEDVARTILLQKNVNIAYLPFTKNEMALALTGEEACFVDQQALPLLHAVATALVTKASLDITLQPYHYVLTIDGHLMLLVRGGLNARSFLIKNA